ncbi:MAG: ABC transporter permease subunit [Aigarchaeota archaeon]|nr:ABC transporter permease subunit [Aigarchaeota archaeon]MCX8192916.1 ABC transporter permease subunit [Nitrososphaeria archaeon]
MTPIEQLTFLLRAVPITLSISLLSFLLGLTLGIIFSFIRIYGIAPLRYIADGYEKVFRSVPVLSIMFLLYFGLGGYIPIFKDSYLTSVIALGLVSGANQSQIFRSSIGSIGRSQMLAATSLGLSSFKALRHVILPQALFLAVPGLGSEIALLIKDSSYSFIIGVLELMKHTDILRAATRSLVFPYIASALIYVALTFPLATYLDKWGSKKKRELGL